MIHEKIDRYLKASEHMGLQDTILEDATREYQRRMEYELRGAWQAGYDYLHVYEEPPSSLARQPLEDALTFTQYVFPAYSERPPEPDGLRYTHTYDLNSVPDHVIRRIIEQGAGIPYDATEQ